MKTLSILIAVLLLPCQSFLAQSYTLKNTTTTEQYPNVSVEISLRNPTVKQASFFKVTENNIEQFIDVTPKGNIIKPGKHQVLLLVENLNHKDRSLFYKETIAAALEDFNKEDYILNIAVFDRVRNDGTTAINYLLPEYTSSKNKLINALNFNKPLNDIFSNNKSADLYLALFQGLKDLAKNKSDNEIASKTVLLYSTAFNNKWSSHTSTESAKTFAIENDITVHSIQYRKQGYEHHRLFDVTETTYGSEIITDQSSKAASFTNSVLNNIPSQSGQEYLINYQTTFPQDGKNHEAEISFGKHKETITIPTINKWLPYYWAGFGLSLLLLLLVLFFILRRRNRKNKIKFKALQEEIEFEKYNVDSVKNTLAAQQNSAKEKENKRLEEQARILKLKNEEKKEQALLEQMKLLGNLPILKIKSSEQSTVKTFAMEKSAISIGRSAANDVVIVDPKVSRAHAVIYFENGGYHIRDNNSSLGVQLNDSKIKNTKLTHGNIITLGETELTFLL